MTSQYKIWRDHANNLGIQCTVCNKTFWTGFEKLVPEELEGLGIRGCDNCMLIKEQDILNKEKATYQPNEDGSSPYPFSQPLQGETN